MYRITYSKKNFSNIETVKRFYYKNLLSILITAELWIVLYYFYLHEFNFKTFIFNVLLLNKPIEHLWYIRMIVMYYFLMPIISYLINRKQTITIIISSIIFIITFGYNGYMIFNYNMYPTTPGLSYSCYFIYFICGYYLSNGLLKRIKTIYIFIVFILSFFILAYTHFKNKYFIWYDNPYLLILSTLLFEMINRIHIRKEEKYCFIEKISIMSFGIYLIHMVYIILLKDFLISLSKTYPIDFIYYTFGLVIITISILFIKMVNIISGKIGYILFRCKI